MLSWKNDLACFLKLFIHTGCAMNLRRHNASVTMLFIVGLLIFTCSQAFSQTVTTFTSLEAWQAAVKGSPQFSEDFSSFTKDTYFQTSTLNVGPFTFQQAGKYTVYGSIGNLIDFPPFQFSDNSGVTYADLYTKYGLITVNTNFTYPIYGWGANFYGAESAELETLVVNGSGGSVIATIPVTVDTGFFGFVISPSENITGITFESRIDNPDPSVGQGFGLENVVGAYTGSGPGGIVFSPSSLNFGDVGVGSESAAKSVKVTNNTSEPASYDGEMDVAEFDIPEGSCVTLKPTLTLEPGKSCTFSVQFKPTKVGTDSGDVQVTSSAGPVLFKVSGTGVAADLVFSPSSVNFGDVTVGKTSTEVTVTATNYTASPVKYEDSSGAPPFAVPAGNCLMLSPNLTLGPGDSCTFRVDFTPEKAGVANGSITVGTAHGPVTLTLKGNGTASQ